MARIVLNTFGSFGDVHPYLGVAIELKRRGHQPVVATAEVYRRKVSDEGIEFAPVRPNVGELLENPEMLKKLWHPQTGSQFLLRDYIIPQIGSSYEDLLAACRGADLILTHTAGYAGPIVAEFLKTPWISVALQPMVFFSAEDPPIVPGGAWARHFYRFGPDVFRTMMKVAKSRLDWWVKPILELRGRIGLGMPGENPLLGGQFSPYGTQVWFSEHFAKVQSDWPAGSRTTGFVFYDTRGEVSGVAGKSSDGLEEFFEAGPPPILFTLGSSAVMHPGEFFRESIEAAERLKARAVLLVGAKDGISAGGALPKSVFAADYLPFSQIMPRVAAVVHQGGIGTVAQCLRAGKPMLIVPWSHDQPDNAARVQRLGVGRTLVRGRYNGRRAASALEALLNDAGYREKAGELGLKIRNEDGISRASDGIEQVLGKQR